MDTRDGTIYTPEQIQRMLELLDRDPNPIRHLRPMVVPPTPRQLARGKVGRNDPCPCGSGRKFKKCCLEVE